MLDASPAHCSTPGDTGKDLRREGLAESTSQAAYLGMCEDSDRGVSVLVCLLSPHPRLPWLSPCSSEGGVGVFRALSGKPVVPAQPAGQRDGSEKGGRSGFLGLHRLHRQDPHPYLCPTETLHTVQGKVRET